MPEEKSMCRASWRTHLDEMDQGFSSHRRNTENSLWSRGTTDVLCVSSLIYIHRIQRISIWFVASAADTFLRLDPMT